MRVLVCTGLLVVALLAVESTTAQGPAEPASASVEVTVWRRISNPALLYVSTRPEGGSWRTLNTPLDMSGLSSSGRFHQSNVVTVPVPLGGGATANVEVTVWRRVSNPSRLYVSTRPEGGRWTTENTALDMSRRSRSGRFHQSNAVLVEVPLPDVPTATTCVHTEHIQRVATATFQVRTAEATGTAFYIGNGEWITNHHVVEDSTTVLLVHGQSRLNAQVVGTLPAYDLALLSGGPGDAIVPLAFVSERPELASFVTIVGFPYGVVDTPSVARGIVSKHLPFTQLQGFASDGVAIQFDAAGNPGNSGGPVVDDCGAVVGVLFGGLEATPDGRPIQGIGFGIAAETVAAQLDELRSVGHQLGDAPQAVSYLTISAFCNRIPEALPSFELCEERSQAFDTTTGSWALYATGIVEFDDVVYRFDGEGFLLQDEVMPALLALDAGCHELEIAENGISTHWSVPYEFCFVDSAPATTPAVPSVPTGLHARTVDVPLAPDDIRVTWNPVPGASWYELWHSTPVQDWQFEATTTTTSYLDDDPAWLLSDSYTVRACNADGCSEFSAVATLD